MINLHVIESITGNINGSSPAIALENVANNGVAEAHCIVIGGPQNSDSMLRWLPPS